MRRRPAWAAGLLILGVAAGGWGVGWFDGPARGHGAVAAGPASTLSPSGDPGGPGDSGRLAWVLADAAGTPERASGVIRASGHGLAAATPEAPLADLGEVFRGAARTARFELRRPEGDGAKAVRFGRVVTGCDCVSAALSTRRAEGGGPVYLEVTLHTAALSGLKRYRVHAEVLDPGPRLLAVDIVARVVPAPAPLLWQPPVFSWSGPGVGERAEAELLNLTDAPLRIAGLAAEGDGFALESAAPMALAPGASRRIGIVRTVSAGVGRVGGRVIAVTDHPEYGRVAAAVPE